MIFINKSLLFYLLDEYGAAQAPLADDALRVGGARDQRHVVVHEEPVDVVALELSALGRQTEVETVAGVVEYDEEHTAGGRALVVAVGGQWWRRGR